MRPLALALALVACDGDEPPEKGGDTPVDSEATETDRDTHVDAPLTAAITPETARAWLAPLRCLTRPDATITWTVDGATFADAITTEVGGDTVPADRLRAGQRWTCTATAPGERAEAAIDVQRANVVLIVADDLGTGDISAYGGTIPTPSIDRLASQGMRMTSGYVSAPVCGPSRAGVMTGRQGIRFGFEYNIGDTPGLAEIYRGLNPAETTLGDVMGSAGLQTAAIGKWHLGEGPEHHPNVRGFSHFFGFLEGRRLNVAPGLPGVIEFEVSDDERANWPASATGDLLESDGAPVTPDDRHLTDHLADEAIAWLRTHADSPFFLYYAPNAPHLPLQATPAQLEAVEADDDPVRYAYTATVHALDAAIGRVLDELDALGVADDTLVALISDNGCVNYRGMCSNAPSQGGKLTLEEGGIRIPMILRWPGRLPAGVADDRMAWSLDFLPTFAAAVGAELPAVPLDGVDLVPALRGASPAHDTLFWRMLPARAVRQGDQKVVQVYNSVWRFDLANDVAEANTLASDGDPTTMGLLDAMDARAADAYVEPQWAGQWAWVTYYGKPAAVLY